MTPVREAVSADIEFIRDLLGRCGLPDDDIDHGGVKFLVAFRDEKLVGAVGLESYPPLGLLRSAAVDPLQQGQGIGRQLVVDLVGRARQMGLEALVLLTTTATEFFHAAGFRIIDRGLIDGPVLRSGQFRGARCASAVVMTLSLAESPTDERPDGKPPVS